VTFRVTGMECAGCASRLEGALARLDGVVQAAVSLPQGLACVSFDPARVSPARIARTIDDLGYALERELESQAAPDSVQALRQAEVPSQRRWTLVSWRLRRRRRTKPTVGNDHSFMTLALAVWVCTLPFVFLLVTPLLGVRAAVTTSLVILVGLLVVCWGICAWGHPPGGPWRDRGV